MVGWPSSRHQAKRDVRALRAVYKRERGAAWTGYVVGASFWNDVPRTADGRGEETVTHTGSCLCGAVRFEISGALEPPTACHCGMCRKQSGHYWASTDVPRAALTLHGEDQLTWYTSSEKVRRGFCRTCGSFLFWDPIRADRVAVAMGALDAPTGTTLARHIYVADQGDYYVLGDGVPQSPR